MADFNESLQNAAAKPSREAPLSAIKTRLRRRHRLRQGAVGVCAVALVGLVGGGIALSSDDGPTVRAVAPATTPPSPYANLPSASVTLPESWVQSPVESVGNPAAILFVGTEAALEPTTWVTATFNCSPASTPDVARAAYIVVSAYLGTHETPSQVGGTVEPIDRPADFSTAQTSSRSGCGIADVITTETEYTFRDQGYTLSASVILKGETPELRAEAFAVLNSLVVTPYTAIPEPVPPTVPPSTVPASADTEAVTAAFLGWIDTRPIDASGVYIEDFASIREAVIGAAAANGHPDDYRGRVDAITRVGENDADVIYSFIIDGQPVVANLRGHAVKIDGVWLVSRDTVCEALLQGPVHCPPRS